MFVFSKLVLRTKIASHGLYTSADYGEACGSIETLACEVAFAHDMQGVSKKVNSNSMLSQPVHPKI